MKGFIQSKNMCVCEKGGGGVLPAGHIWVSGVGCYRFSTSVSECDYLMHIQAMLVRCKGVIEGE